MATDVIIKILDSDNNLDFEIPISSDKNSPLSIIKSLTDLTELTKKGGVQSRKLKIPISKEIARKYDFFNQAQHDNNKDVDGDKEAVIIIDGNEAERGKVRITDFENKEGFETLTLLFFGNNFVWTELGKNLTMSDIDWTINTVTYSPTSIRASWSNSVNGGDEFVYPLENRGGRKLLSMVHTEDFRPAFFFHSILTRFYQNIGHTFESDFMDTVAFKKLVITFFGRRFRNTEESINDNFVSLNATITSPYSGVNYSILTEIRGSGEWNDSVAPASDPSDNFDKSAVNPFFTVPISGYYTVKISDVWDISGFASVSSGNTRRSFAYVLFNNVLQENFIGNITGDVENGVNQNKSGEIVIKANIGDTFRFLYLFQSNASGKTVTSKEPKITIRLQKVLTEGFPYNFQDVLDDKVKVLDIINDVGRMFNLVFDTDPVLKKVTIEPRNDFYNEISEAVDFTDRIDTSKPIKTIFNSSFHKRDMVFSYKKDSSDKFVDERNKEIGTTLAEYSHGLPNKFKEGVTTIKTSVLAATYTIKDIDSLDVTLSERAPHTARYWDGFETETPLEMLEDHAPRLLSYVVEQQLTNGTGSLTNLFKFYDEISERVFIPAVLPHNIELGSNVVVTAPFNLYWHKIGTDEGLFGDYWSKTVTEIVNGVSTTVSMLFNQKQWNDFKFKDVAYIDEPIEIKGYWLIEKIENFQPENSNLVKVKLLQRIEYDVQVETATIIEQIGVVGRFAPTPISDQFTMTMTVEDGNGNEINVPMEISTLNGTKTTLIA